MCLSNRISEQHTWQENHYQLYGYIQIKNDHRKLLPVANLIFSLDILKSAGRYTLAP